MKGERQFRHWPKRGPGWKHYCDILRVLESLIPVLTAIATLLLFFLMIFNPGTLLALALFLLVLAVLGYVRRC